MMRSLAFGVSGLKSHQTRMDIIGNNIANVNTAGFKAGRATFTEVLSQTQADASNATDSHGGINPQQIGLGAGVATVDRIFTDGSLMSTGRNTDLALSGNAFFVIGQGNETYYTRNGAFEFDGDGNYVLPGSGMQVKGWTASNGVIDTSGLPGNITIPAGQTIPPQATENITYVNNLDATTPTIQKMTLTDSKGATIAVSSTTNAFSINDPLTASISNVGVTFSNGVTLPSTNTGYSYGTNYRATISVTLSDGIVINASGGNGSVSYTIGNTISAHIDDLIVATSVGRIFPANTTTTTYSMSTGASLDSLTIVSGPTVTTPGGYDYVLSDGSTLRAGSNSYTIGSRLDNPTGSGTTRSVSIIFITGFLNDGSYFTDSSTNNTYSIGSRLSAVPTVISGNISNTTGTTLDSYSMTSGTITPKTPVTTSNISLTTNIGTITVSPSDTTAYVPGSTYNSTVTGIQLTLSDGTVTSATSTDIGYTLGHSIPLPVTTTIYDSLGGAHQIVVYFEKSGSSNQWQATLYTTQIQEADGTIVNLSMPSIPIPFTSSGTIASNSVSGVLDLIYSNGGASSQTITLDFANLVQYVEATTLNTDSDGYPAGTCTGLQIDSSGIMTGIYSNGVRRAEGQIAVAQFNNASGLIDIGNGLFQATNNSGTANVKTISAFGGSIAAGALEMSNVDVASEFSDMIASQRGFQTNSKIITTSDEFIETIINLKR